MEKTLNKNLKISVFVGVAYKSRLTLRKKKSHGAFLFVQTHSNNFENISENRIFYF